MKETLLIDKLLGSTPSDRGEIILKGIITTILDNEDICMDIKDWVNVQYSLYLFVNGVENKND